MIQKELQTLLEDTLGVKIDALKSALTSEDEVTVEFNQGTFLNDESLGTLKESMKKAGYNDGKVAGLEMEAKRLKEHFGIEIEGKDLNKIIEAHGQKVLTDAKIEPNKKIADLQGSLEALQSTYNTDMAAKDQEISSKTNQLNQFSINSRLMSELPDNLSISPKHFLTIAQTEVSFEQADDGAIVVKRGDAVLKDKLEKPIPVKDFLNDFATDNSFLGKSKGRGQDNDYNGGGKSEFKTMHDVYRHMEKNKIDPTSKAGSALIEQFDQENG